jgi:hypothetical protein
MPVVPPVVCAFRLVSEGLNNLLAFVILEQLGELLLEGLDFGAIADQDIGIAGIVERVVLVVGLGVVEALQWHNLGDDGLGEDFGRVELGNI